MNLTLRKPTQNSMYAVCIAWMASACALNMLIRVRFRSLSIRSWDSHRRTPQDSSRRHVLELGSGTGLCALSAAGLQPTVPPGGTVAVLATDYREEPLELLRQVGMRGMRWSVGRSLRCCALTRVGWKELVLTQARTANGRKYVTEALVVFVLMNGCCFNG